MDEAAQRAAISEATREARRTGGMAPALGMDDSFLGSGNLINTDLRDANANLPWAGRSPGPARNADGPPDVLRETIDNALRATRDAVFDGSDTANFSLAGLELTVTLRGDRRAIAINGLELLGAGRDVAQPGETWQPPPPSATPAVSAAMAATEAGGARRADADEGITLNDVVRFLTQPVTVVIGILVLGVWMVIAVASANARRN